MTYNETREVKEAFRIENTNESEAKEFVSKFHGSMAVISGIRDTVKQTIFAVELEHYFQSFNYEYMLSILYPPNVVKKRYRDSLPFLNFLISGGEMPQNFRVNGKPLRLKPADSNKFQLKVAQDFLSIFRLLDYLRQSTVRTKWITAEVDRITALIYFIIIILLFIIALLVSLVYNAFFQNFTQNFPDIVTRLVILTLSSMALGGVIYMFKLRIKGLRRKAATVLRYIILIQTIKIGKETFDVTLREIERYLNDSEWALGEYWVDRIKSEYEQLFYEKLEEKVGADTYDVRSEGIS